MSRGKTKSRKTLTQRRHEAADLYTKGFTVSEVSDRLKVSWDTAKAYKRWHEARLESAAQAQPQLLQDVLKNTIQSLAELDQVRAAAWRTYHTSESKQVKLQALNTIRSAQADKAKLFGLFGVKQDFFIHVQNVTAVQGLLLDFLSRELCEADRQKLERFFEKPEVVQFLAAARGLPQIELTGEDEDIVDAEVVG